VLWLTGPDGVDLTAIAALVEKKLHSQGRHTFLLDGENLERVLGEATANQATHCRRLAEVARLFAEAGLIVLTSCAADAENPLQAREILAEEEFTEIFINSPTETSGKSENAAGREDGSAGLIIDAVRRSGEELAEEIVSRIDFSGKL